MRAQSTSFPSSEKAYIYNLSQPFSLHSPTVIANVETAINALHVGFAGIAELTVDISIYLTLEHARALVSLRGLLVSLKLLYLMCLALDDLLQIRDAAVALLVFTDEGLAALGALYLHLRAVFHQMEFYLLLRHLFRNTSDIALFGTSVNLVSRTVEFKMLDEISVPI